MTETKNKPTPLQLEMQTLTPLWTGGVDGKVDRIHESGILGSLRWWYEAIVRGLGGDVCNPLSDQPSERCPRSEKQQQGKQEYCDVCQLFGATGKSRGFRLKVNGGEHLFDKTKRINIVAPGGNRGWHFGAPFIATSQKPITGSIQPLCHHDITDDFAILLALIDHWSGLGAKIQHGHGVVRVTLKDGQGQDIVPDVDAFIRPFPGDQAGDGGFPSLRNMFFARLYLQENITDTWWRNSAARLGEIHQRRDVLHFDDPEVVRDWRLDQGFSVPVAPAIRYKLRYGKTITIRDRKTGKSRQKPVPVLNELNPDEKSDTFFGYAKGNNRRAAMFNISNAYQDNGRWQFRMWGWLPERENNAGIDRHALLTALHHLVTQDTDFWSEIFGDGVVDLNQSIWHEPHSDGRAYLKKLLEL